MIPALLFAWTVVLGIISVVLWRDAGILRARVNHGGNIVANGIEIGAPAPAVVRKGARPLTAVFLSDACDPCFDVAHGLEYAPRRDELVVVIAATGGDRPALMRAVGPRVSVVATEQSEAWQRAFDVRVSPFAVRVEHGLITAKGHLRDADDLASLSGVAVVR